MEHIIATLDVQEGLIALERLIILSGIEDLAVFTVLGAFLVPFLVLLVWGRPFTEFGKQRCDLYWVLFGVSSLFFVVTATIVGGSSTKLENLIMRQRELVQQLGFETVLFGAKWCRFLPSEAEVVEPSYSIDTFGMCRFVDQLKNETMQMEQSWYGPNLGWDSWEKSAKYTTLQGFDVRGGFSLNRAAAVDIARSKEKNESPVSAWERVEMLAHFSQKIATRYTTNNWMVRRIMAVQPKANFELKIGYLRLIVFHLAAIAAAFRLYRPISEMRKLKKAEAG